MRTSNALGRTIIAMAALLAVTITAAARAASYVGDKFPNFTFNDGVTGKSYSLEDFRGKVVLVDFWATWCSPCVGEIPHVKSAYEKFKDKGLVVISVSLDQDKGKCKSFISERGMTWYHVIDGGGWGTRLAKKYGINSIPQMFIIDHNGWCISDSARGERLSNEIGRAIKKIPAGASDDRRPDGPRDTESPAPRDPAVKTTDPRGTLDPARTRQLRQQLEQAGIELQDATTPLLRLSQRFDDLAQAIASIDSSLPVPARPTSTRDDYLQLRRDLADLRRDVFVIGIADEAVIKLPSDPFAAASAGDQRAFFQAKTQLNVARTALEQLKHAFSAQWDAITASQGQLKSLVAELGAERGDQEALENRCEAASGEARDRAARWRDAWKTQLAELHVVVAKLDAPGANIDSRCDALEEQIASVRQRAAKVSSDEAVLASIRDDFVAVCKSIKDLSQQVKQAGGAAPGRLPTNPFERRTLRDRMALAEIEVQGKVALEAIDQIRKSSAALSTGKAAGPDAFAPRIKALQDELVAKTNDATALVDVRNRFAMLCAEILAARD